MKNDQNKEAAGYAAILGFNHRQTIRALLDKLKSACWLKTPCSDYLEILSCFNQINQPEI